MPPRYEGVALLGKGGGGEVWSVKDRVTGRRLALKVLAEDAGEVEVLGPRPRGGHARAVSRASVCRRCSPSGGCPGSTRRWLVRELVDGISLEEVFESGSANDAGRDWLIPLARAADQLTVLHRAGLLHGDIKPANVIVGPERRGTLVDLGLAAPWREGGTRARGLTPKYAAPELLEGDALTVRCEVYALGATLKDGLAARRTDLDAATYKALEKIAERATADNPQARFPSVDELASTLKSALRIETKSIHEADAWPVLGADAAAQTLAADVAKLAPGQGLAIVGPRRSGRSTLAHRLSWTLGVSGAPVASIEPRGDAQDSSLSATEVVELELESWKNADNLVDRGRRSRRARRRRARASRRRGRERCARIIAVASEEEVAAFAPKGVRSFVVPPLDDASAGELVKRAIPSLPDRLTQHLLDRTGRRPGRCARSCGASTVARSRRSKRSTSSSTRRRRRASRRSRTRATTISASSNARSRPAASTSPRARSSVSATR